MKDQEIIFLYDTDQRFTFTPEAAKKFGIPFNFAENCDRYLAAYKIDETNYKIKENYKIAFKSFAGNNVPSKSFYLTDLRSILKNEVEDPNNPSAYKGFYKGTENLNNDYKESDLVCIYVAEIDTVNVIEVLKVRTNKITKFFFGKYRIRELIPFHTKRNVEFISNAVVTENGITLSKTKGFVLHKMTLEEHEVTCKPFFKEV